MIMNSLRTNFDIFLCGLWQTIRNIFLVFYIDADDHRQKVEKEAERQQRLLERQNRLYRTPSPIPSSASAMFVQEMQRQRAAMQKDYPDELSLDSMRKNQKPSVAPIPFKERKILIKVLQCCGLNGCLTWTSIFIFEYIILPTIKSVLMYCFGKESELYNSLWEWLPNLLSNIFITTWLVPLLLLSKIVSALWFSDIANETYKVLKGKPNYFSNFSKFLADFLFNVVVQVLFFGQAMLCNLIPLPYVGTSLYFIHMCFLYSLYSFEYKWINMGWELHRRLDYIERNWPYFMGFALPLVVLTNMSNSIFVSSSIFSTLFPLFILSANAAQPIVGMTNGPPVCLFSPTIFVSNLIFAVIRYIKTAKKSAQPEQVQQQQHNHHQQLLLNQEKQLRRRSSARDNTPTPTSQAPQFRYPQPPQRINSARSTPERQLRSDISRTQIRYNESTRTLIPTPVPGAPGLRSNTNTSIRSAVLRR